jgi:hypothetical protein
MKLATRKYTCHKETEIALLKQELSHVKSKVDEIHAAVVGSKDELGLKGRVSNIETSLQNTKTVGTFFAAMVTITIAILGFFGLNK